jgi:hypothetical protein
MVIVDMWQKIKMTTLPGGKVTLSTPSTTVKKKAQQRARMLPTTVTTLAVQFVEEPKKRRRESTICQKHQISSSLASSLAGTGDIDRL